MSKKTILAVAIATLAFGQLAKAQTNIQVFYDFGKDRKHVTTTVEGFYNDNWGNTFFFIDHDFNNRVDQKIISPNGTYMEIARCLNFWQNVPVLNGFSLQVEYNGGIYNKYAINSAFLAGIDYFVHSKDFKNTFNFKVLYKHIVGVHSQVPMQFTFVWGLQDLFGAKGLRFSGFADFWWQDHDLYYDHKGDIQGASSKIVFLSEPQLWYNVGQWFGVNNLNIGGEVELAFDFGSAKGFWARPCAGIKWVF
ncbi:MAG: DUF5020 family protein [Bacteroidales bacterium]|nr:DUF5020 family protein [Bacteroidales bacterium]